jgi:hypothetical protein
MTHRWLDAWNTSDMSNDGFLPPENSESGLGELGRPPLGAPADPLSIDSTQVMPVVPPTPFGDAVPSLGGVPSDPLGAPGGAPFEPADSLLATPWYKQPGTIAGILIGLTILLGIALLVFFLGRDDDAGGAVAPNDSTFVPVSVVLVRNDAAGNPLNTMISAAVEVPAPGAYRWVVPADAIAGQNALRQTDASGRAEFRWVPDGDADLSTWTSSVALNEMVAPENGGLVPDLVGVCALERNGTTDRLVIDVNLRPDDQDGSLAQIGRYTFPNARFVPGDRVNCTVSYVAPVEVATPLPTTTLPEPTTTLP